MLYQDRIHQLGLPEYKGGKHRPYLMKLLLNGYRINTRICRYIGIGNLHSDTSAFSRRNRLPFSKKLGLVADPVTGKVPPKEVLIIWMTQEQISEYFARRKTLNRQRKGK
jgi:hypothetical protein